MLILSGLLLVANTESAYGQRFDGDGDSDGRTADITVTDDAVSVTGNTTNAADGGKVEVWIEVTYNGDDYY